MDSENAVFGALNKLKFSNGSSLIQDVAGEHILDTAILNYARLRTADSLAAMVSAQAAIVDKVTQLRNEGTLATIQIAQGADIDLGYAAITVDRGFYTDEIGAGSFHLKSGATLTFSDIGSSGVSQLAIAQGGARRFLALTGEAGSRYVFDNNRGGGTYGRAGSAISNNGAALVTKADFTNNTAGTGSTVGTGGAIYNDGGMVLEDVAFTSNTARNNGTGGAIYNNGAMSITNGTFEGNNAGSGGAIHNYNSWSSVDFYTPALVLTDVDFRNNIAANKGGAISAQVGTVTTIRVSEGKTTTYAGNTAGGNANSIHLYGGAVLNIDVAEGGMLDMQDPFSGDGTPGESYRTRIQKSGDGEWRLSGQNDLYESSSSSIYIGGGSLHLLTDTEIQLFTLLPGAPNSADRFTVAAGATLSSTGGNTIKATTITLSDGSKLKFDMTAANDTDALLTLSAKNDLVGTLGVGEVRITNYDSLAVGETYILATSNNGAVGTLGSLYLGNSSSAYVATRGDALYALATDADSKDLLLNVIAGNDDNVMLSWSNGAGNNIWSTSNANWSGTYSTFLDKDSVTFTAANAGSVAIENDVKVSDMKVTGGDYIFTGTGGITTDTTVMGGAVVSPEGKLALSGGSSVSFRNGANTWNGISVNDATLGFTNANQLGASEISFTGNGTLRADATGQTVANNVAIAGGKTTTVDTGAHNLVLAGAVGGSGGFAKDGTGKVTLSGAATYTGDTTINAGTLEVAGTLAGGAYAGKIANNGVLALNNTTAQTLSGAMSGTGNLVKSGAGELELSGASGGYSGAVSVTAGTLKLSTASAAGTGAITNNAVLDVAFAGTLANTVGGTGTLNKNNAGKVTIANDVSQRTVNLNAGEIALAGGKSVTASTAFNAATGTTVAVSAANGGNTLTAGTATFADGANLTADLTGAAAGSTALTLGPSTALVIAAGDTLNINTTYTGSVSGTDNVIATGGATVDFTGKYNGLVNGGTPGIPTPNARYGSTSYDTATIGKLLLIAAGIDIARDATWTNAAGDGQWNEISANWNLSGSALHVFKNGDTAIFGDAGAGSVAVGTGLTVAAMTVNNSSGNDYTFTGSGIGLSGATGTFMKTGTGTVTFNQNAANAFTSASLEGGRTNLAANNAGALGTGTVTFKNNAQLGLADGLALANNIALDAGGGTLAVDAGTVVASGILSGSGPLNKTGAGALELSASSNDYTGSVAVTSGTLKLSAANAAGTGSLANNATVDAAFAGRLANEVTGTGVFNKTAAGDLTLEKDMTQGTVNLNAGSLTLTGGNTLTATTAFNAAAGTTIAVSAANGGNTIAGGAATFADGTTLEADMTGAAAGATALTFSPATTLSINGTIDVDATFTGALNGHLYHHRYRRHHVRLRRQIQRLGERDRLRRAGPQCPLRRLRLRRHQPRQTCPDRLRRRHQPGRHLDECIGRRRLERNIQQLEPLRRVDPERLQERRQCDLRRCRFGHCGRRRRRLRGGDDGGQFGRCGE
ncbi:MAG: autotransporter-associated beta strand repeat-containing protein [Planctomycetes bacterium]|nr:autotransporter-associated beta strand repeat-containing protein [Planctomycetota bacterium]